MLNALVAGETDGGKLAELAVGKLKKKRRELSRALQGKFQDHHRFQIRLLMEDLKECEKKIFQLDRRIDKYLEPYEETVRRLDAVPGIDRIGAAVWRRSDRT
ncbi:transposase (fragment) [Candidatus Sulfopaludibacter sp. SbA3]